MVYLMFASKNKKINKWWNNFKNIFLSSRQHTRMSDKEEKECGCGFLFSVHDGIYQLDILGVEFTSEPNQKREDIIIEVEQILIDSDQENDRLIRFLACCDDGYSEENNFCDCYTLKNGDWTVGGMLTSINIKTGQVTYVDQKTETPIKVMSLEEYEKIKR